MSRITIVNVMNRKQSPSDFHRRPYLTNGQQRLHLYPLLPPSNIF